jgi:hypothetical protein
LPQDAFTEFLVDHFVGAGKKRGQPLTPKAAERNTRGETEKDRGTRDAPTEPR